MSYNEYIEVRGEPIEAVVITGEFYSYDKEDPRLLSVRPHLGKILTWEQAFILFNYEYDDGYGGQDCHDVEVYTKTRVYYVHEYDGSTCLHWVNRNPTESGVKLD